MLVYLGFQSAVAHELISNHLIESCEVGGVNGFKALSRMSSFPTPDGGGRGVGGGGGFKALSRMSSFPTLESALPAYWRVSFKALSRMSSFPTL